MRSCAVMTPPPPSPRGADLRPRGPAGCCGCRRALSSSLPFIAAQQMRDHANGPKAAKTRSTTIGSQTTGSRGAAGGRRHQVGSHICSDGAVIARRDLVAPYIVIGSIGAAFATKALKGHQPAAATGCALHGSWHAIVACAGGNICCSCLGGAYLRTQLCGRGCCYLGRCCSVVAKGHWLSRLGAGGRRHCPRRLGATAWMRSAQSSWRAMAFGTYGRWHRLTVYIGGSVACASLGLDLLKSTLALLTHRAMDRVTSRARCVLLAWRGAAQS